MRNKTRKVIWVENINFLNLPLFFFAGLFSHAEILYDEHQSSIYLCKILKLLRQSGRISFIGPASLLLNVKDKNGYAIEYRRAAYLSQCVDSICASIMPDEPKWFKAVVKSYLSSYLGRPILFITMAEQEIAKIKNVEHEIYLKANFANYIIINFFMDKGIKIRQLPPLVSYVDLLVKPFLLLVRALYYQLLYNKIAGTVKERDALPALWIEHEHTHGVWAQFRRFLSNHIDEQKYKTVYYFDRDDTPIDGPVVNALNSMGLGWIDCRKMRHSHLNLSDIKELVIQMGRATYLRPLLLFMIRLHFEVISMFYKSIYIRFNVKLLIQHQEGSWRQEAQKQALEANDGIMIGLHWSSYLNYEYPSHITPQHVFLVWGQGHYELLMKKGNTCDHILPCGVWIDDVEDGSLIIDDFSPGVRFKIAVFDTDAAYNIEQSPDAAAEFYLAILELLDRHGDFGIIVKSKKWTIEELSILPAGEEIVKRLVNLKKMKRAIILDSKVFSPAIAARYADLSVCLGINSAGIIASLHGGRVIHWDCTGWMKYPIYIDKNQKVIFLSMNETKEAIIEVSQGDAHIGDFSKWRKSINYFDDSSGRTRVMQFINLLMDEIKKSDRDSHSLDRAVNKYMEANHVTDDFYQTIGWWGGISSPDGQ